MFKAISEICSEPNFLPKCSQTKLTFENYRHLYKESNTFAFKIQGPNQDSFVDTFFSKEGSFINSGYLNWTVKLNQRQIQHSDHIKIK